MPGFRPTAVIVHPDVEASYADIEEAAKRGRRPETAIWKALQAAIARVRTEGQWGEVIPASRIPPHFVKSYGVTNLYCVDLAGFRRGFYTIVARDVVLLDLVDHRQYDRWFGL